MPDPTPSEEALTPGELVSAYARALTPEQLAELFAIKDAALILGTGKSPIAAFHFEGDVLRPLVERGIVESRKAPKGWSKDFRSPVVTPLGERVMLCRAEWELRKGGFWPKEESDDDQ